MTVSEQQLRDELAALERKNASLEAEIAARDAVIAGKAKEIDTLETKVSQLTQRLDWLLKKVFGRMSEKRHLPLDPEVLRNEPSLFPEMMTEEEKAALDAEVTATEAEITKNITVKVKSTPSRKPLDTAKRRHIQSCRPLRSGVTTPMTEYFRKVASARP